MSTTTSREGRHGTPGVSSHPPAEQDKLAGIRHLLAVGSGKGGVGKVTVAANLALGLHPVGGRVGLVDADVLVPHIPGMLGLPTDQPPEAAPDGKTVPLARHGLKAMSMGLLTGDEIPAALRGPMAGEYLHMFVAGVDRGELDYLILDLSLGIGDTQLALAQSLTLSGAVIVTTPPDVSLKIARRGLRMFETVHVTILGIIENMSTFTCPHCGQGTDIFRSGGGERVSRQIGVPFLESLPLDATSSPVATMDARSSSTSPTRRPPSPTTIVTLAECIVTEAIPLVEMARCTARRPLFKAVGLVPDSTESSNPRGSTLP